MAVGSSVLAGCAGQGTPPRTPPKRIVGRTEVVILGTMHGAHLTSQRFSLQVVHDIVERVAPDVVLVEIPPDRFEASLEELDALGEAAAKDSITDSWLRSFPELWAVVLPQRQRLGYEVVPVSGWKPRVSQDRKAYWDANPNGPASSSYREAQQRFVEARKRNRASENPCWVNGPEYLELAGAARRALAEAADSELGEAAVMRINEAHWRGIGAAIETHRRQRILLVYGARHRWYTQPRIQALEDVTLLDVRDFMAC